ncbi:MAG: hypothetical protein QXD54_03895 [Candidatus Aenigmatarchaeota archaeon]
MLMVKGSLFTTYFMMFIGGIIVALVLIYVILYGGVGIATSMGFYDARANAQRLSSLISASSSFYGNFSFEFRVKGLSKCTVNISEEKVKFKVPGGVKIEPEEGEGPEMIIKETSEITFVIVKPNYINVEKFDKYCTEQGLFISSRKEGDKIWLS